MVRLNRTLSSIPLVTGNDVELEPDYVGSIQHMAEAVATATDYVNVEFYITAWDHVTAPLFDQMVAATERGVTVRLLFDHLGSRGIPGYQDMLTRLEATQILWHPMLPIRPFRGSFRRPDLRNHRKLLVVDGRIGFTGSQNLTEPGYNKPKNHAAGREWVELMVRLQGPVVATLDAVFSTDWYTETGEIVPVEIVDAPSDGDPALLHEVPCQLVPSGPGIVAENNLRMFTTLIYGATRRLSLTSPYFVPDESLLYAVTTAAQRGVEVELFVSEQSDQFMVGHAQASYYRALLEAGVSDPPLPRAVRPARQALHRRRRRRGDRVEQHGHALVRAELRDLADAARPRRGGADADGRGRLPRPLPAAHPGGVGPAAGAPQVRRQRDAADRRPAVGPRQRLVRSGA